MLLWNYCDIKGTSRVFKGHFIIDGHVHYCAQAGEEYFADFLEKSGTDMANLAAITRGKGAPCTEDALRLKALYPDRFFVTGGLDLTEYVRGGEDMGRRLAVFAKDLISRGCDGVKMLEGKPQLRQAFPIPDFDLPCWDAYWTYMEEEQIPLLMHVNDPASFWDRENVPEWAAKMGWFYDDTYINNEEQYRQILTVLSRHPGLRVTFAHFFFMSESLDRLGDILARYPNVMTDLTPGIELYDNLSRTPDKTREFFDTFHDRIIYGTDIGSRFVYGNKTGKPFDEKENTRRHQIVRDFLTGKEPLTVDCDGHFVHDRPEFEMIPLGLDGERLDEILSGNFLRFIGRTKI